MKRNKRRHYYSETMDRTVNNSKQLWKIANEILTNKACNLSEQIDLCVNNINIPLHHVPDELNQYFVELENVNVNSDVTEDLLPIPAESQSFYLHPVTEDGNKKNYIKFSE